MSNLKQLGAVISMYTADNDGYFFEDMNWVDVLQRYSDDERMLLCPMARKTQEEGGRIPFAAWGNRELSGSYGLNYWVINAPPEEAIGRREPENLWRRIDIRGAGHVPMFFDCSSPGVWPLYNDKPPEYEGQPKGENINGDETRDCCINRHKGTINGVFMDFSVRGIGLKELWRLKWHRAYDITGPEPDWPEWMDNFKD